MQLISQLPMLIKAVYVDGWGPAKKGKRVRHLDDFAARVKEADGGAANDDFTSEEQAPGAIKAVFCVIKAHGSEGEMEDLRRTLPEQLRPLLA